MGRLRLLPVATAILTLGAIMAAAGCGSATPVSPSQQSPSVTALALQGSTNALLIGGRDHLQATATLVGGGMATVEVPWVSDTPSVVTIDRTLGELLAVGPGVATVSAEYHGVRASRQITVLPDLSGRWTGTSVVRSCTVVSSWFHEPLCQNIAEGAASNTGLPFVVSQTNGVLGISPDLPNVDLTLVRGIEASASLATDGAITIRTRSGAPPYGYDIVTMQVRPDAAGRLVGTASLEHHYDKYENVYRLDLSVVLTRR